MSECGGTSGQKGKLIIKISEGRVEVHEADWKSWTKPLEESELVFNIGRIIREYEEPW